MKQKEYLHFAISLIAVILSPLLLLYLFDLGIWMSVCFAVYICICFFYVVAIDDIKTSEYMQQCLQGIVASIILPGLFYSYFIYDTRNISVGYGRFDTQMDTEDRNLDYKINTEKNKMIQKSVDDYNRQWNN